ncbi:MAG: hypothetical protein ACTHLA_00120 [Asticcacaulis sp.]|uniref:hypothetical protein n=1 Tax=Asticcacaulis sp. TaxID=1872648 RepID=UPI003F7B5907
MTIPWYLVFGGYVPLALFGLPAWLLLRHRLPMSLVNCAVAGLVIAAAPGLILQLLSRNDYEYGGGHVMVLHGHYTGWGWLYLVQTTGEMALIGLLTGAIFWLLAAAGDKNTRKTKTSTHESGHL